ncbi:MAG TPA: metallophosphoesterase [Solirubrobacteraceae bacterium]
MSDLHLGSVTKLAVLRDPAPRAALVRAVRDCDRLVILGDLLELRHSPERDALVAAREALTEIGAALGPEREVVILAGNHDHPLLDGWLARRTRDGQPPPMGLETEVDWEPGEPLAEIAEWLSPARVRGAYPGIWLRDDVYATHGHYADLHLTIPTMERLAAGVMGRIVGLPPGGPPAPATAEDYESALAPIYAWIHAIAQRVDPQRGGTLHNSSVRGWVALTGPGRRNLRRRSLTLAYPALIAALNRAKLGPLHSELTGAALRRAGLRGIDQALDRLGVAAEHVIFGHTHRAGPLPHDDQGEWRTCGGGRLINSGCWVSEPSFVGAQPHRSPYRVGFCVTVEDQGPPVLSNLLD